MWIVSFMLYVLDLINHNLQKNPANSHHTRLTYFFLAYVLDLINHNFNLLFQDWLQLFLAIFHTWLENYYARLWRESWISLLNISMEYSYMLYPLMLLFCPITQ
jgi:hypothetical protein